MKTTMIPSMNLTKKQLYDICMAYADINTMNAEFISGMRLEVQTRDAEKQKLNDDIQQTQATLIAEQKYQLDKLFDKHGTPDDAIAHIACLTEQLTTARHNEHELSDIVSNMQAHVQKLTATLEAQKGANVRWAADYKQLQEQIAGWRRAHQEQTMDTDDANWKTKRMFGVVEELKTRVQQLTNEAAVTQKTIKTLCTTNARLEGELKDAVPASSKDGFDKPSVLKIAYATWDNHIDVMVALGVDNGELIDYYLSCTTSGHYKLHEGDAGAKWVHATGISGDRLYDHYVRWCWKVHGHGACFMKEDFVLWMRARCTAIPMRDEDGNPLPPNRPGLMYGQMALGFDWKADGRIPLNVTVPEYFDLPPPPAWAYGGDTDDESLPASPGSDDDDLDVVVADIEDNQVSARAMRLKKRNMKKRKKGRK